MARRPVILVDSVEKYVFIEKKLTFYPSEYFSADCIVFIDEKMLTDICYILAAIKGCTYFIPERVSLNFFP